MNEFFALRVGRPRSSTAMGEPIHGTAFDLRAVLHELQRAQGVDPLTVKLLTVVGTLRGAVRANNRPRAPTPIGKPFNEFRAADVLIVIEGLSGKTDRFVNDEFEGCFHDDLPNRF